MENTPSREKNQATLTGNAEQSPLPDLQFSGHRSFQDREEKLEKEAVLLRLEFLNDNLKTTFTSASQQDPVEIDWAQGHLERGGSNDQLLFLKLPGWGILYWHADPFFRALRSISPSLLQQQPALWDAILRDRNFSERKSRHLWAAALIFVFIVFGFASVFWGRSALFGRWGTWIPMKWEQKIAEQLVRVPYSEKQRTWVEKVRENFAPLLPPDSYVLHLKPEPEPNAYATLGGRIFLNRGLLQILETNEQVLSVLAHERIHVQQRHIARSLAQSLGLFAFFQVFLGDFSGVVAVVLDQGGNILQLKHSRSLEEEADERAIEILVELGFRPQLSSALERIQHEIKRIQSQQGAPEILQKLQKLEWFSTHPEMDARIEKLKQMEKSSISRIKRSRELSISYLELKTITVELF